MFLSTDFPVGFVSRSAQLCTQHTQSSKIDFTTSTWRGGLNQIGENDRFIGRYESCIRTPLEWRASCIGGVVGSSLTIIYLCTCGKLTPSSSAVRYSDYVSFVVITDRRRSGENELC